jgi:hypothetical protein
MSADISGLLAKAAAGDQGAMRRLSDEIAPVRPSHAVWAAIEAEIAPPAFVGTEEQAPARPSGPASRSGARQPPPSRLRLSRFSSPSPPGR